MPLPLARMQPFRVNAPKCVQEDVVGAVGTIDVAQKLPCDYMLRYVPCGRVRNRKPRM